MMRLVLIALGGSLGALARYGLGGLVQNRFNGGFPSGTLAVNLIGCFLLGAMMALVVDHPLLRPGSRFFFATGFLGAFTTFSTFSYETSALVVDGSNTLALVYVLSNVLGGITLAFAGRWLAIWLSL